MQFSSFQIHQQPSQLPSNWNNLTKGNIFLSKEYLTALYHSQPKNIQLYFVSIHREGNLVGIALFQRVHLKGKEIFRERFGNGFWDRLKAASINPIQANILVLGNLLHTGEHAFRINTKELSLHDAYGILQKASKEIAKLSKKQKSKILILLEKDFFEQKRVNSKQRKFYNFHPFAVQPNMILRIRDNWKGFDDYLADMTTKYRTRAKRAKKKLGDITSKELSLEEIQQQESAIFSLYKNVSDHAGFNTFVLAKNHFYELRKNLGNRFKIIALYKDKQMVAFYTIIANQDILEAYFLGYDSDFQKQYQLYLNILYQIIDYGIQTQNKQIVLARTAMEIKSSVGAEPYQMFGLIRHKNPALQFVFKPIFKMIKPNNNWVQRQPFKT